MLYGTQAQYLRCVDTVANQGARQQLKLEKAYDMEAEPFYQYLKHSIR